LISRKDEAWSDPYARALLVNGPLGPPDGLHVRRLMFTGEVRWSGLDDDEHLATEIESVFYMQRRDLSRTPAA